MATFIARDVMRQVKEFTRQKYAWPGAYPQTLILADGDCLCHDCTRDNFKAIAESTIKETRDGWRATGVGVNWENPYLHCDNCSQEIQSSYGG